MNEMSEEQEKALDWRVPGIHKDTSPMVRSQRIKRKIRIQEINTPASSLFDTKVDYPSDALPEWFAPLQPIVEDETFTSMVIRLGRETRYHVSLVEEIKNNG